MKFTMKDQAFETETAYGKLTVSGNEDYGFRPFQLMVSSIAVCSGGVLRKVMEKQRMTVHDIEIEADVEREPSEANRLTKISIHYTIKGDNLSEARVEKAVHLASKNCPMARTVEGSVEIKETFTLV
ncbi:osmotically inducible protein C [Alteribacter lacisalsi]|uniref:Osmotically inducible protein C n=1 Tax=Alteribacter lacisalsi TaxID=2045244 RepID=A0A2W0HIT0_9BACI|nr:OsmC family protein [Alteribacter lacisalsi]PYZ96892.1 osmotically inducible protein C [Alteribacter lacisalsi]